MRTLSLTIFIVMVILLVLGSNMVFRAEAVEHYGYNVDVKGPHNDCISCHDDVIAKSPPRCMPVCFFGESHPNNKEYPPSRRRNEFKPVSVAEQSGIKFVNGKVDCISCHSLLLKSRYLLRIEYGAHLCFACHRR